MLSNNLKAIEIIFLAELRFQFNANDSDCCYSNKQPCLISIDVIPVEKKTAN